MGFELEVAGWGIAFFPGEVLAPLMFLALIAALSWHWGPLMVFFILSSEWILKTAFIWWRYNQKVWLRKLI